jgi:hypothetical protein
MRLLKEVLHNQAVNIHGLTVSREAVRGIIVDLGAATIASHRRCPEPAGVFFERLWQYDQVVFDASVGSKCADQVEA